MSILSNALLLAEATVINQSLEVMWKGMLAVLIAIVAIIICIYIMQFIIQKAEKIKADRLQAEQESQENENKNS